MKTTSASMTSGSSSEEYRKLAKSKSDRNNANAFKNPSTAGASTKLKNSKNAAALGQDARNKATMPALSKDVGLVTDGQTKYKLINTNVESKYVKEDGGKKHPLNTYARITSIGNKCCPKRHLQKLTKPKKLSEDLHAIAVENYNRAAKTHAKKPSLVFGKQQRK